MTRKRMLAMCSPRCSGQFLEEKDVQKIVVSRSLQLHKVSETDYQHSRSILPKPNNPSEQTFQKDDHEKCNSQQLMIHISNMLFLEKKNFIDTTFMFYVDPVCEDKVNADMRDYSVKDLQIMNKVFFELPLDIFVKAVALVDRFITRVKVKPKYMSCVATACLVIAAKTAEPLRKVTPCLETLAQLSKCGGSAQDLERMMNIIMTKLNFNTDYLTSYDFLDFFHRVLTTDRMESRRQSETLLDLAQTSFRICCQRPSVVAMACLLANNVDNHGTLVQAMTMSTKIDLREVMTTAQMITQMYHTRHRRKHSSRTSLVWSISKRTMLKMKTSSRSKLTTISEEAHSVSSNNGEGD